LAGLAAAGADGIARALVLPPARDEDAVLLPTSLPEALSALRADEVLVEALGKDFVEWYTLVKDAELADVAANTARFAATGMDHDAAVQEAWNSLYFEFV
jgi:glutamine synthetase